MILKSLKKSAPEARGGISLAQLGAAWREDGAERTVTATRAMRISAVCACVEIISSSIAVMPMFVFNEKTKLREDAHPLGRVLWQRPNEAQTQFDFLKYSVASVLLSGSSYVWNYRNGLGEVVERIPIPSEMCEPFFDVARGEWFYGATDPKSGKCWRLSPQDISHYRIYTTDGVHGVSVLERAAQTVRAAEYAEKYQQAVYRSGGRPSGVLQTDADLGGTVAQPLPDGTEREISKKEVLRREWERIYGGADNAFRTAILDHGLKYTPISATAADLQFVESKNLTVMDIARFFCIPPYKLGEGKQSYASNEQNNIEFCLQTLQPLVTQREQEDTTKLLLRSEREDGLRVRQNMDAMLRADAKARAEVERIYRDMGVYSVDDIRAIEDLPPVPGGKERLASLNYVPLEDFRRLSLIRNGAADAGGAE